MISCQKPNKFLGIKRLDSMYQSNLFLRINSVNLQKAEDNAIGRYEGGCAEGLGIRITLKYFHESGILFNHKSLSMTRRISNTLTGKYLKKRGDMPSNPTERDVRDDIASDSS